MAFVAVRAVLPIASSATPRRSQLREFKLGNKQCTVFSFTKGGGDVAANLDSKLEYVDEIIVLDADGLTVIAATFTTGFGQPGTFTTALAALGGGVSGFIICIGNNVRH